MNRANSFVRERYDAMTKARSIAAIETAWRDMDAIVMALDRHVAAEEVRTGITDPKHVTYSTAAIAARIRSSNLKKSVIELKAKLLVATAEHNRALANTALERRQDAAQSELPPQVPNNQRTTRRSFRGALRLSKPYPKLMRSMGE